MGRTQGLIAGLLFGTGTLLLLGSAAQATDGVAEADAEAAVEEEEEQGSRQIVVEPGEDTLHDAVEEAESGDTLLLQPGVYVLTHTVLIEKDLTIRGATKRREDVNIAGVAEDFDFEPEKFGAELENLHDWGHLLFVRAPAQRVSMRYFTIKGAPAIDAIDEDFCLANFGLNHSECMGDAIHTDGVAVVKVQHVEASLNAGNGIFVDGAQKATLRDILGVNNGAFGIDVDSALDLAIRRGTFIANQVSGVEASGHPLGSGLTREQYVATVSVKDTLAKGNSEIGVEVERFLKARIEDVTCADNREDGFDADRVGEVVIRDSAFINNLNDALELFPVDVPPPDQGGQQPTDFSGSTIEDFDDLEISGNVGEELNHPPTEN